MYPRAADLGSAEVQKYSDRELFWIVKNSIRLSGMPAFGRVESDERIWHLVRFVRTVPSHANPSAGGRRIESDACCRIRFLSLLASDGPRLSSAAAPRSGYY